MAKGIDGVFLHYGVRQDNTISFLSSQSFEHGETLDGASAISAFLRDFPFWFSTVCLLLLTLMYP